MLRQRVAESVEKTRFVETRLDLTDKLHNNREKKEYERITVSK